MSQKALTELSVADLWREVKGNGEELVVESSRVERLKLARELFEGAMVEERRVYLGIDTSHERTESRVDHANGFYARDLETGMGVIEALRVPRVRRGGFEPSMLRRYARRHSEVDRAIVEMFLAGVSTRRAGEVIEHLLGRGVSAQTVSRLGQRLEGCVRHYHTRELVDKYLYLVLDGIRMSVRGVGGGRKRVALCAFGIDLWGRREMIDFYLADGEGESHWARLLESLYRRGVRGKFLRLVTSDGAPGLVAAVSSVWPHVAHQRCWVHKMRNVANKLPRKLQQQCLAQARSIYLATNRQQATERFFKWCKTWRQRAPRAVACLEKDIEALLRFFSEPKPLRTKLRTTNIIERSFREVRRRTRPMSSFNNDASCERIIYSVFRHLNNNWEDHPLPHFTHIT
jgi:putative transposase